MGYVLSYSLRWKYLFIVLIATPGHLRALASIACKIVKERTDVAITFFCVTPFYKQLEREIGRYFSTSVADSEARANIRRVGLSMALSWVSEHSLDSSVSQAQRPRTRLCYPTSLKLFQGTTTSS